MSLCLKDYKVIPVSNSIDIVPVENLADATLWSNLFQQSFGYLISDRVIDVIKDQVSFCNLKYEDQFIGTMVTYKLDNSIGIHSMGNTEPFRKRGFAEMAMQVVLSDAIEEGLDYAHLQASPMGLSVYKKLGFEEIFKMYNYRIK
ncbi:ribosomal protein S18 acetylase RimI-like enzyme [Dysgonomonas sp. PFB1-18]|uniref:GNAT family N-acetyltransferase n=1 Tax=unclassified Dysgonomonas TaxID=2630389 RepID=UPI002476BD2E|nr:MULTISPECIES: GNAT family N-acetyltransferase [unclassified Dysgonomonas]MDH6310551.1 ribosomal protein S18 acetylase RimI-like enzyme [Dysgonomonas sp. PF1-14]MDH6340401.1 ribosomal protein S18 acetylase RimI-like enzyme [Dysgonomonas sp. PF1-16]MDH6382019.1 ribosomal protein S18 acetylase RimI-like enzyme [Dysgonomonas sp. PFB1-18]MDH6399372.1 ribosomal protein S18 acetylase RimI-like enzyme [Dysgonomonas sp. PF1-23]